MYGSRQGNQAETGRSAGQIAWIVVALMLTGPTSTTETDPAALLTQAREQNAATLAPRAFSRAERAFDAWQSALRRNASGNRVATLENELREHAQAALDGAERARIVLSALLEARERALAVDGFLYDEEAWERAENQMRDAIAAVERRDAEARARRSEQAIALYEEAEIEGIKARTLAAARAALASARDVRAERHAPISFGEARSLMERAEAVIAAPERDLEQARALAEQAHAAAERAAYIAAAVRKEPEPELRAWILALDKLAAHFGVPLDADDPGRTAAAIREAAAGLATEVTSLTGEVAERNARILALQEEVSRLRSERSTLAEESRTLSRELDAREAQRERIASLNEIFAENEAQVLREAGDVVIRLVGLDFAVGQSRIEASENPLLDKLARALTVFPNRAIVIEGHTDSQGTDANNIRLSTERAQAVRQYLLAQTAVPTARIISRGHGESRPVASNDTAEGRARNRRIDIRILDADT